MTDREHRLRERIDQLRDERDEERRLRKNATDLVARLSGSRARSSFRRCPYCGTPCAGAACGSHRDLLDLEQKPLRRTTTAPASTTLDGTAEAGAGGSNHA